jgi:catechol 2,3-dioxygenase-like lactoylglutathione lyase family enzyme
MTIRTIDGNQVTPYKLAHLVLRVSNLERSVAWYSEVLGAHLVGSGGFFAGITYDEEHHRIGLIEVGGAARKTETFGASTLVQDEAERAATGGADALQFSSEPGLEHVAFTYDSLDGLLNTYVRLRDRDIKPILAVNHGPTTSFYYNDPRGTSDRQPADGYDSRVRRLAGELRRYRDRSRRAATALRSGGTRTDPGDLGGVASPGAGRNLVARY